MEDAKNIAKNYNTHLTKHFRIFLSDTRECKVTVHYGFLVQTTPV